MRWRCTLLNDKNYRVASFHKAGDKFESEQEVRAWLAKYKWPPEGVRWAIKQVNYKEKK